jgi:hypothetical protein
VSASIPTVQPVDEDAPTTRYAKASEVAWGFATGCFLVLALLVCVWYLFVTGQEPRRP